MFDKQSGREFPSAPRNVANEGKFYDFKIKGKPHSLDPAIGRLEDKVGADIYSIIATRTLPSDPETRIRLASFVALQKLRTDSQRQQYMHLFELLEGTLKERQAPNAAPFFTQPTAEELHAETITIIPELSRVTAQHILAKSWMLFGTSHRDPFYISDNPVTMHNTLNQHPLMGGAGLALLGVEIYLPISDTLCMGFLCPSIEAWLRESLKRTEMAAPSQSIDYVRSMVDAFDGNRVHMLDPVNVMHQNSLQVDNAEKQVYSRIQEFSVAKEMIALDPKFKSGQRYTMGPPGKLY